jgi:hypothetical protein
MDHSSNRNTDYSQLLDSIHTARNEVFPKDTVQEEDIHQLDARRYYEILVVLMNH